MSERESKARWPWWAKIGRLVVWGLTLGGAFILVTGLSLISDAMSPEQRRFGNATMLVGLGIGITGLIGIYLAEKFLPPNPRDLVNPFDPDDENRVP